MSGRGWRAPVRLLMLACGLATGLAPGTALAEPAPQRWQLLFFHPFRPGVLQQCELSQWWPNRPTQDQPDPAEPGKAWVVEEGLQLDWGAGLLEQAGPEAGTRPRTELCFALRVDGQLLVTGAVLAEYSARRLDFPTLVRLAPTAQRPQRYQLRPRFLGAGVPADPPLPAWRAVLEGL